MPTFTTSVTVELDNGLVLRITPGHPDSSSASLSVESEDEVIDAELTAADLQGLSDVLLNTLDQIA